MHSLHYIVEDEEDVDFEEYLLPDNYKLYLERQQSPQKDIMVFPPKYRFRPNQEQVRVMLSVKLTLSFRS